MHESSLVSMRLEAMRLSVFFVVANICQKKKSAYNIKQNKPTKKETNISHLKKHFRLSFPKMFNDYSPFGETGGNFREQTHAGYINIDR